MPEKKTPEERYEALMAEIIAARSKLSAALRDKTAKRPASVQRYFNAARERQADGELEIDEDACVSEGGDHGAYVQAWIWIDDADVGEPCPKCGESLEEGFTVCGVCAAKENKP